MYEEHFFSTIIELASISKFSSEHFYFSDLGITKHVDGRIILMSVMMIRMMTMVGHGDKYASITGSRDAPVVFPNNQIPSWNLHATTILLIIITSTLLLLIITRPKPAYGRQGLARSWGQDTNQARIFGVFSTSHFRLQRSARI